MFYCDKCRKELDWPEGFSKSFGPCEICKKVATCNDVPSKYLPEKGKNKKRIYYSIQNGGDGSAFPEWFETEELALWDQEHMDEGWGEPCYGYIEVESDGNITFNEKTKNIDDMITEREDSLSCSWIQNWERKSLEKEIQELKEMKERSCNEKR